MRKLVFVSNSLDRMNIMDRYMFKDEFDGEVYIVTDDRINDQKQAYLQAQKSFNNINLKKATILGLKQDGLLDWCLSQLTEIAEYDKKDLAKFLFFIITFVRMYFVQNENDQMLQCEDDIIMFKNPNDWGWSLSCLKYGDIRASFLSFKNQVWDFVHCILQDKHYMHIDNADDLYKQYINDHHKSYSSQAFYIHTYDPNLPHIFCKWIKSPNFQKALKLNRKENNKLFKKGFCTSEKFMSAYFVSRDAKPITDAVIQLGKSKISNCRSVYERKPLLYHYTVINDHHIMDLLPILMEQGPKAYSQALKTYKLPVMDRKFVYMDMDVLGGERGVCSLYKMNNIKTIKKKGQ